MARIVLPMRLAARLSEPSTLTSAYQRDPYLDFQPHFAFSLPVQIFCNGIILTLAAVLLIHLALTGTYHWALAKLNYILQLSAVMTLCTSLTATIYVIFTSLHSDSRGWPYMLNYVAVAVPPDHWKLSEKILWFCMEALTSGLSHITHIQLLTLMYPSKLEARLIFILIGPLAIASSAMLFCSLSPHQRAQDLGDAIRGVCNTTLALLFSAALFIWGFAVNKRRAWRTDGGTAAFGAAAIFLAVMSVINNFVLIFVDDLRWLPALNWAVVLWQTFLGWWWWVGAGMSIGEVEDMLYNEQERKDQRRRKKIRQSDSGMENNRRATNDGSSTAPRFADAIVPDYLLRRCSRGARAARQNESTGDRPSELVEVIASPTENQGTSASSRASLRRRPQGATPDMNEIEMTTMRQGDSIGGEDDSVTSDSTSAPITVPARMRNIPLVPSIYTSCVLAMRALRRAHRTAAQAEVSQSQGTARGGADTGWGLGNFGLRERAEAERRIRDFRAERRRRMLLGETDGEDEGGWRDEEYDVVDIATPPLSSQGREVGGHGGSSDVDSSLVLPLPSPDAVHTRPPSRPHELDDSLPHPLPPSDSIYWRWGPLRRWRLQDRTTY